MLQQLEACLPKLSMRTSWYGFLVKGRMSADALDEDDVVRLYS
jgi:hypothetical protein